MASSRTFVPAQTLKGYRDILPDEALFQNALVEKVRPVLEQYGFLPLDTPCVEYLTTLTGTGGEETEKDIIRFKSREGEDVGLRFDLTVPFARLLAQYPEKLRLPFRRYQLAPVFRNDKRNEGRNRQFRQFDFDAAGSESMAVDAEIVAVICDVLKAVGLENSPQTRNFEVHVNNRKLLDAIMNAAGADDPDTHRSILRVIDRLGKIGMDNVRKELGQGRTDDSGDPIGGVGLPADIIGRLMELIQVTGATRAEVLETLTRELPSDEATLQVLEEMAELNRCLQAQNVCDLDVAFRPSLVRDLDYYTGPIFEAYVAAAPEMGAVIAGGRYDHLVDRFLKDKIPATGASFRLDRFAAVLRRFGTKTVSGAITQAIIVSSPGVPASYLLSIAHLLRSADIRTEVYFGEPDASVSDQLSAAKLREVPVAVIVGPDEYRAQQAAVTNLRAGLTAMADIGSNGQFRDAGKAEQRTVGLNDLSQTVKAALA